jgi:hypothetical protein
MKGRFRQHRASHERSLLMADELPARSALQ